ncbi:phosphatase PAP2 family protein [Caenimonas sedimenti]|uniref:Phosphatase PAP2 family protein n=1 Tax=Caenimonas sedimenti TaxID=2596921 RepID=A0A562ZHP7_9BURK|nr:phosphatase PAP2 family protein [Caenimonas sedimenti]
MGDAKTLTLVCLGVALVLIRRREHLLATAWVVALAGNGLLNNLLKQFFARERPVHDHVLDVSGEGWSFPSGHSSGAGCSSRLRDARLLGHPRDDCPVACAGGPRRRAHRAHHRGEPHPVAGPLHQRRRRPLLFRLVLARTVHCLVRVAAASVWQARSS